MVFFFFFFEGEDESGGNFWAYPKIIFRSYTQKGLDQETRSKL